MQATINAATIHAAALAAAAIAPEYNPRDELHSVLCNSARFADVHLATAWDVACIELRQADGREVLSTAAQDAHNWARAQALQETADDYWHAAGELPPTFVTIQTSERGRMKVHNTRERLQGFAAQVKANQKAFGGGIKPTKRTTPAPAVTWPATALKVLRESLEDANAADALALAEQKLGAVFYDFTGQGQGRVVMLVAPLDVAELPGLQSGMRDDGLWVVYEPTSGHAINTAAAGSRASAIKLAAAECERMGADRVARAIAHAKTQPADHAAARLAWCKAHNLADVDQLQEHAAQAADVADVADSVAAVVATAAALAQMMQPAAKVAQEQASTAARVVAMADTCTGADGAGMGHAAGLAGHQTTSTDTGRPAGPPAPVTAAQCPGVQDLDDTPAECDQVQDLQPPATISPAALAAAIPVSLARGAFNGVSFSPERRGDSARAEFGQTMAADYAEFHAHAVKGGTLDKLAEEFARYSGRLAGHYRAWLSSESRCISSFITGPSNFPVARAQKRNAIAHRRLGDYLDGRELARRAVIRNLRPDLRPIMAGDADAAERLAVELAQAERWHATMTAANAAIRKHAKAGEAHQVAALLELGISEASALELLHPKLHYHRPGFQPYELTNHGANVRRIRARLEQIERNKAKPVAEFAGRDGIRLEDDPPANRVRLHFPGKPDAATRDALKRAGFRWAPSVGAWQAYRKAYTLQVAQQVAGMAPQAPQATAPAACDQVQDLDATPTERDQVQDLDAPAGAAPRVRELHSVRGWMWTAKVWRDAQGLALQFVGGDGCPEPTQHHSTHRARAQAMRAMVAKTADNAAGYDDSDDERDQVQDLDAPAAQSDQVQDLGAAAILTAAGYAQLCSNPRELDRWQDVLDQHFQGRILGLVAHLQALGWQLTPTANTWPMTKAGRVLQLVGQQSTERCNLVGAAYQVREAGATVATVRDDLAYDVASLAAVIDAAAPPTPGAQSDQVQDLDATPAKCDQVQDLQSKPAPRTVQRTGVPPLGQRLAHKGGAWEAWFYVNAGRPCMVFYAGRAQKPTARHWYGNPAERMAGLMRRAKAAEAAHDHKAQQTAARKAENAQPHGLTVGRVLVATWGYEQTNQDFYQVVALHGKRTVEVRPIASDKNYTGDMSGKCAPCPDQFTGASARHLVKSGDCIKVGHTHAVPAEIVGQLPNGQAMYRAYSFSEYA